MEFIKALEGWGIPVSILIVIVGIIVLGLVVEAIGKIFGKKIPVCALIAKPFKAIHSKKTEKNNLIKNMHNTLSQVNEKMPQLEAKYKEAIDIIKDFNTHYDPNSINQRDSWMLKVNSDLKWAHDKAKTYDTSVNELKELATIVKAQQNALELNNKMTSEMYKQSCRRDILDFEHKLINARRADKPLVVSREEFRKIRKTYDGYENFLETYGGTNGEVDDAMEVIRRAERGEYSYIEFLEDVRD